MITVVDSGGANLASVLFALERVGLEARLSRDPDEIRSSAQVLLPGVGAAGAAMKTLRERELVDCLRELAQPVLGICLGMQILFERSEEGAADCLGVIPGTVGRLTAPARPADPAHGLEPGAAGGGWLPAARRRGLFLLRAFLRRARGRIRQRGRRLRPGDPGRGSIQKPVWSAVSSRALGPGGSPLSSKIREALIPMLIYPAIDLLDGHSSGSSRGALTAARPIRMIRRRPCGVSRRRARLICIWWIFRAPGIPGNGKRSWSRA